MADVAPSLVAGDFLLTMTKVAVGTSLGNVIGSDPDRVYLGFIQDATGTVTVSPVAFGSTAIGWVLAASSNSREFTFSQYPLLVNLDWQAIASVAVNIYVVSISYKPRGI